MTRDPNDRCDGWLASASTFGNTERVRCVLRPHGPDTGHVMLHPEGERDAAVYSVSEAGEAVQVLFARTVPRVSKRKPSGSAIATARTSGFTGEQCGTCGALEMVKAGKCSLCRACGSTSGGCS
jgi:hypothetical protein